MFDSKELKKVDIFSRDETPFQISYNVNISLFQMKSVCGTHSTNSLFYLLISENFHAYNSLPFIDITSLLPAK